jgi:AraC-like DNA-binding protein
MEQLFNFLNDITRAYGVRLQWYGEDLLNLKNYDDGLRSQLIPGYEAVQLAEFLRNASPRSVYFVKDMYRCNYCMFKLLDKVTTLKLGNKYCVIGPWLEEKIMEADIDIMLRQGDISCHVKPELTQYLEWIPQILSPHSWKITLHAFVLCLYGDSPRIRTHYVNLDVNNPAIEYNPKQATTFSMKMIEERYRLENAMVEAISKGEGKRTFQYFYKYCDYLKKLRVKNELQEWKNHTITLNTLARKGAEQGFVHPVHIEAVSTDFVRSIEGAASVAELIHLCEKILQRYGKLVRDFSLKDYSPVIRNVINFVDINLREPLSLSMLAAQFNVNPSYLSTLFKKERGITITDYINTKRVEQAASLLCSSRIYIQDVAEQCGFLDVNYFSRLFKRYYGQSPQKFRVCTSFR